MGRRLSLVVGTVAAWALIGSVAVAQQSDQTQETNPQTSATTTVKPPAGVEKQPAQENQTQGVTGAQTQCKSASAEMTNGAVETCKK